MIELILICNLKCHHWDHWNNKNLFNKKCHIKPTCMQWMKKEYCFKKCYNKITSPLLNNIIARQNAFRLYLSCLIIMRYPEHKECKWHFLIIWFKCTVEIQICHSVSWLRDLSDLFSLCCILVVSHLISSKSVSFCWRDVH